MNKLLTDQEALQKMVSGKAFDRGATEMELQPNGRGATRATLIKELKPLMVQEGVIHAFHSMGGCPRKDGLTLLKLTISLETPRKTQIRQALNLLTESSVVRLIGARLRPERSHRPCQSSCCSS